MTVRCQLEIGKYELAVVPYGEGQGCFKELSGKKVRDRSTREPARMLEEMSKQRITIVHVGECSKGFNVKLKRYAD